MTFFCKAVTFSREAVKFFCKAVTFYLSPLTSYYMDSLTGKHLTHVAHVAPNSGWGEKSIEERGDALPSLVGEGLGSVTSKLWFGNKKLRGGMGDMGGLFSVFTNLRARTRKHLTVHP